VLLKNRPKKFSTMP